MSNDKASIRHILAYAAIVFAVSAVGIGIAVLLAPTNLIGGILLGFAPVVLVCIALMALGMPSKPEAPQASGSTATNLDSATANAVLLSLSTRLQALESARIVQAHAESTLPQPMAQALPSQVHHNPPPPQPVPAQQMPQAVAAGGLDAADNKSVKRMLDQFSRVISPEIAEAMRENGEIKLGGRETRGALLFLDIRGFTTIAQRREPQETMNILNTFFAAAVPLIESNGGVVDKFVGDGLMALFGIPKPLGNNGLSAINAAIELQQLCAKLNAEGAYGPGIILEVGIGVAKGKVIAGNIGSAHRMSFTAIGPTVNLAARLCAYAGRNEILCCNFCYLDVQQHVVTARLSAITLKGIDTPINTYRIFGWASGKPSARHFLSESARMAGQRPMSDRVFKLDEIDADDLASRVTKRLTISKSDVAAATSDEPTLIPHDDLDETTLYHATPGHQKQPGSTGEADALPAKATRELASLAQEASAQTGKLAPDGTSGITKPIKPEAPGGKRRSSGGLLSVMASPDSTRTPTGSDKLPSASDRVPRATDHLAAKSNRLEQAPGTDVIHRQGATRVTSDDTKLRMAAASTANITPDMASIPDLQPESPRKRRETTHAVPKRSGATTTIRPGTSRQTPDSSTLPAQARDSAASSRTTETRTPETQNETAAQRGLTPAESQSATTAQEKQTSLPKEESAPLVALSPKPILSEDSTRIIQRRDMGK